MDFPFTQEEWKEVLTRLYKRAAVDHQFHVLCTRDSHAAIKLICGEEIPKSVHIRFEEQQSDETLLRVRRVSDGENSVLHSCTQKGGLLMIAATSL